MKSEIKNLINYFIKQSSRKEIWKQYPDDAKGIWTNPLFTPSKQTIDKNVQDAAIKHLENLGYKVIKIFNSHDINTQKYPAITKYLLSNDPLTIDEQNDLKKSDYFFAITVSNEISDSSDTPEIPLVWWMWLENPEDQNYYLGTPIEGSDQRVYGES